MTNEQELKETEIKAEQEPAETSMEEHYQATIPEAEEAAPMEEGSDELTEETPVEETNEEEPQTAKQPKRDNVLEGISLNQLLEAVLKIPDVKVDRDAFLKDLFKDYGSIMEEILEKGPVQAGISRETLNKMAEKLIAERTGSSSLTAFSLGFPGILAKREGVPADLIAVVSMVVRLSQELAYIYGSDDFAKRDDVHARGRLKLFLAGALNVQNGDAGVRVVMAPYALSGIEEIPHETNNHAIWKHYTEIMERAVMNDLGKNHSLKVALKALPILGGIVNSGFTIAAVLPMANRLHGILDFAAFDYTLSGFEQDFVEMETFEETKGMEQNSDIMKDSEKVVKTIEKGTKLIGSTGVNVVGQVVKKGGIGMVRGGSGMVGLVGTLLAGGVSAAMGSGKGKGKGMGGGKKGGHGSSSDALGEISSSLLNSTKKKKEDENMNEIIDALQKLKQLKDDEIITEEEFIEKRKELLARI